MPGRVIFGSSIINTCRLHMSAAFWQQAIKRGTWHTPEQTSTNLTQTTSSLFDVEHDEQETSGNSDVKTSHEVHEEDESEECSCEFEGSDDEDDELELDEREDCIRFDLAES